MGRGRFIPRQQQQGIKVHRTVQLRMEASEKGLLRMPKKKMDMLDNERPLTGKSYKYVPKAKWQVEPIWVD